MITCRFLGAKASAYDFKNDRGEAVKGISYKLFLGLPINEKDGVGYYPITFKVEQEVYSDFINNIGEDSDIEISYTSAYDRYGREKNILTGYKF